MTKVTNRQHLPALDNSKPVNNPDLLNIADKNYTSTIMRYSNLAILYSQLETDDKHIVGAINEINKKVQPAKRVGETDVVGGVIIGDGLSVTDEGVLSTVGKGDVYVERITITPEMWKKISSRNYRYTHHTTFTDLSEYEIICYPADYLSSYSYMKAGVWVAIQNYAYQTIALDFNTEAGKVFDTITVDLLYVHTDRSIHKTFALNPVCTILPGIHTNTYSLLAAEWNTSTHIYTLNTVGGQDIITPYSTQVILPMPSTSSQNVANNIALQAANIQDAGQDYDTIYLYAENIPTIDLQIQVMFNA